MISALQKISGDPYIESIQKDTVAAMCIANPFKQGRKLFGHMLATHPPIEKRIEALHSYV
jgi:Zn-dependent protease with chaperone function